MFLAIFNKFQGLCYIHTSASKRAYPVVTHTHYI